MQDGLFRGRTGEYKVGRAIFLFSGGTSHTYKEFVDGQPEAAEEHHTDPCDRIHPQGPVEATPGDSATNSAIASDARSAAAIEMRLSKVVDSTSRLRGYLDVMGINDRKSAPMPSKVICLRRAVLLRSLLEIHAKPIFVSYSNGVRRARIDRQVVKAFLHQREYKHGVRSMEAIIQMSHWLDGEFVAASLPSMKQLEMHVGEKFMKGGGNSGKS